MSEAAPLSLSPPVATRLQIGYGFYFAVLSLFVWAGVFFQVFVSVPRFVRLAQNVGLQMPQLLQWLSSPAIASGVVVLGLLAWVLGVRLRQPIVKQASLFVVPLLLNAIIYVSLNETQLKLLDALVR